MTSASLTLHFLNICFEQKLSVLEVNCKNNKSWLVYPLEVTGSIRPLAELSVWVSAMNQTSLHRRRTTIRNLMNLWVIRRLSITSHGRHPQMKVVWLSQSCNSRSLCCSGCWSVGVGRHQASDLNFSSEHFEGRSSPAGSNSTAAELIQMDLFPWSPMNFEHRLY